MAYKPVDPQINFVEMEKTLLKYWYEQGIVKKYLTKNQNAKKKFSFLDGPITANNPMGVHHAWGRTYKDIWQRYYNLKGYAGRFQNGFDCQGLWVEVEVEKELGFKNKKDIESYGIDNFVNKCKQRVNKYSSIQTEQTKRLGNFMDWDNSYFTMSDENNYAIWGFLKECNIRNWIYKGHDVVPWCPRCETAISQHEILTEDYKEIIHDSIFIKFPIVNSTNEFLLVWTTTPWTLIANTAVAVDANKDYSLVEGITGEKYWISNNLIDSVFKDTYKQIIKTVKGKKLLGLQYQTPFDDLPLIKNALKDFSDKFHRVIATDDYIMPISQTEGTGLVHTSTSTGEEDHKLGVKLGLPVIPAIDDAANYLEGFGQFSGLNAKNNPEIIIDFLQKKEVETANWIFNILPFKHRYPACWRCKKELVWKVADEWYVAMDKPDPTDPKQRTFRQQMIDITKKIIWIPDFGLDRELDWLKNMHDWLISKKNRYWGLALPIYECNKCGNFEIIGSKQELRDRSISGWDKFNGNSPHRPWIDEIAINCSKCNHPVKRILDVGNPWLDAGIVSISTLPTNWFPADFITESFPGQFKNWFYSLIAMSTVMKKTTPFKSILGYALLLDEKGQVMHKSSGNMIEFNEGADRIGVDVMRWIFASQNPEDNLLFGYKKADETRRQFLLILWNIYKFFVTYSNIDGFTPNLKKPKKLLNILDCWIIARLNQLNNQVSNSLDNFNAQSATKLIEDFVSDLSLWYVRRSRDRVGPTVPHSQDKSDCYSTLHHCLVNLMIIMAPFTPYVADEIYQNLTNFPSVHLADWPKIIKNTPQDVQLFKKMKIVRKVVELGLSQRKSAGIKVRQPLASALVSDSSPILSDEFLQLIKDELNVKTVNWEKGTDLKVSLNLQIDEKLKAEGQLRDLIREVQELRKKLNAQLNQFILLKGPIPISVDLQNELKRQTLSKDLVLQDTLQIELL